MREIKVKFTNIEGFYKVDLTNETTIDISLTIGYSLKYPRNNSFSDKHEGIFKNKIARIILDKPISQDTFEAFKKLANNSWKSSAFSTIIAFDKLLTKKFKLNTKLITLSTDDKGSYYYDTNDKKQYVD